MYRTDYLKRDSDEKIMQKYEETDKKGKLVLPANVPNEDLPFRTDDDDPLWLARPFHFLHAPIIKFIHHLVFRNFIIALTFHLMIT